ncbi:type IV pilus biogenesis protein PilP [Salmonella enterica subsp. enterica]|nr:type IV pilus biogenesis protein PilP [Salmonella enterica subsp. enterica]
MQMRNNVITFLILSFFLAGGCFASDVVQASEPQHQKEYTPKSKVDTVSDKNISEKDALDENSVAEQLARIKSEVVILKAEAAREEARKQLEQVTGEKKNSYSDEKSGLPLLKSIYGNAENQLHAEFEYSSGDTVDARVGTVLPGHFKVMAIAFTSAQLQDDSGKKYIINLQHVQDLNRGSRVASGDFSPNIPAPRWR